jgi:hypothetical protein
MKQEEQKRVIQEFRAGTYNVLVCTCIGEEGLDIGEVDLIVNFDCLSSPIRMIQRVGRTGRKRNGAFHVKVLMPHSFLLCVLVLEHILTTPCFRPFINKCHNNRARRNLGIRRRGGANVSAVVLNHFFFVVFSSYTTTKRHNTTDWPNPSSTNAI